MQTSILRILFFKIQNAKVWMEYERTDCDGDHIVLPKEARNVAILSAAV